ncbi:gustatory receptor for sugar taste 43a-like [Homalodisca vitripennis]|uniref:gustatory receptor for sugar taste 43a-like n=1 Tax=Homalodisca vitripennis TaxID=197043 RepID=UPI001EE9DD4E|nr:gustatory receptor for sugar taste 43a-like [Homalodisca vitripennis]
MNAVYLAVYSMQYTALAVQLQYVSVVDGIRRRLQLVNDRIFEEVNRRRFRGLLKLGHLPPVDLPELQRVASIPPVDIHCLSDLHWSLCSIIHRTNSVFSWQLLAHVVTLLLHTIIAPYSLFTAMSLYTQGHLTDRYLGHLFMQAVWAVKHWVQLLLLVWPCSAATQEANRTASIVCKLLNKEMSPETRKQLETLVLQLFHHNAEFSVFGLFTLHFPILTSIAGAVTTYLVILIQFQNADSNDNSDTPSNT